MHGSMRGDWKHDLIAGNGLSVGNPQEKPRLVGAPVLHSTSLNRAIAADHGFRPSIQSTSVNQDEVGYASLLACAIMLKGS
jgi:hypothetical protein